MKVFVVIESFSVAFNHCFRPETLVDIVEVIAEIVIVVVVNAFVDDFGYLRRSL
jgi:hypothetical protein